MEVAVPLLQMLLHPVRERLVQVGNLVAVTVVVLAEVLVPAMMGAQVVPVVPQAVAGVLVGQVVPVQGG